MTKDLENRIKYGGAWICEMEDWKEKHPLGPVHWRVWDSSNREIGEDIPANELPEFLVARGLLFRW